MTKKNKLATAIVGAALTFSLCYGAHKIHAQETDPPAKMPVDRAIKLDRDLSHLREYNATVKKLQEEVKPYSDDALAIFTEYRIDPQAFNAGQVNVVFPTGEIQRAPQPPAPAAKK